MRIYVDNQAELTVSGNTISGDVDLPEGKHTMVVVAWDNTGAVQTSTVNFTVNASATPCLPFGPGLRVCTPAPGETVDSPVGIEAGAIPTAQRITAMRVYVDDAVAYFASNTEPPNSQSIGVALLMAAGSHHLVIVAYQNDGSALTASETITVR
jgi:hypothetical protein